MKQNKALVTTAAFHFYQRITATLTIVRVSPLKLEKAILKGRLEQLELAIAIIYGSWKKYPPLPGVHYLRKKNRKCKS